jgi:uncharacterized protein YlaI
VKLRITRNLIVDILLTWKIKPNYKMVEKGLCDYGTETLYYNPKQIPDCEDFYVTIIHEAIHAIDPEIDHRKVEYLAYKWARNKDIRALLNTMFECEERVTIRSKRKVTKILARK